MRRFIAATILGAMLSTPAFAADATEAETSALTISPATIAAAANAAPAASTDLATRSTFKYGRPSMLPALYATSAALQGYDTFSTLNALRNGAREANPFMKGIVNNPAAFVAMKAGVTTRISAAIARPRPLALGSSGWVMMTSSTNASCARTCDC